MRKSLLGCRQLGSQLFSQSLSHSFRLASFSCLAIAHFWFSLCFGKLRKIRQKEGEEARLVCGSLIFTIRLLKFTNFVRTVCQVLQLLEEVEDLPTKSLLKFLKLAFQYLNIYVFIMYLM